MNKVVRLKKRSAARAVLEKINALADDMRALSDQELQRMTARFRKRYQVGETLDELLPEAYAAMREASRRVLGLYPYDVQILAAIAMHEGRIVQMMTGEGKTLSAVMPLYLNALTGKSCILVTMNDYLAIRDGTELAPLYLFMGLTERIGVPQRQGETLTSAEKRIIYSADIVYTTSGTLGFDYLLENLSSSEEEQYLRPYYYVVIDEADAVLLDAAQMPLVISGAPRASSNQFEIADRFVQTLRPDRDYEKEEGEVWLTDAGYDRAERYFAEKKLFHKENFPLMRHVILALRANTLMEAEKDYTVENGKICLLNSSTGRIMENTRLRGGIHQAIETKEHVPLTRENRAMASITFQDFFSLFPKIAGMSGTAVYDRRELHEVYGLSVKVIPTNRPCIRQDLPDAIYESEEDELKAVCRRVCFFHLEGRPVLAVTAGIQLSERLSALLLQEGVPHNVLNAHHTANEAAIIREAGRFGAVTVSTNIAGRGTDIRLDARAAAVGGLAVLGVGRMPCKRLEMQARGRAGRQGDPGISRFYVSLEDDVIRTNGAAWLKKVKGKGKRLRSAFIQHAVDRAQTISEEREQDSRRWTMTYGTSLRIQRELVYSVRDELLYREDLDKDYCMKVEREVVRSFLQTPGLHIDRYSISRFFLDNIHHSLWKAPGWESLCDAVSAEKWLMERAEEIFDLQVEKLPDKTLLPEFIRLMALKAIDEAWIEQVDYLQQLRHILFGRKFARHDLEKEYQEEAYKAYLRMGSVIRLKMMRNILMGEIEKDRSGKWIVTPG